MFSWNVREKNLMLPLIWSCGNEVTGQTVQLCRQVNLLGVCWVSVVQGFLRQAEVILDYLDVQADLSHPWIYLGNIFFSPCD